MLVYLSVDRRCRTKIHPGRICLCELGTADPGPGGEFIANLSHSVTAGSALWPDRAARGPLRAATRARSTETVKTVNPRYPPGPIMIPGLTVAAAVTAR